MAIYINGIGLISPQKTTDNKVFLDEVVKHETDYLNCVYPNFKEYINPIQLRRMSKLIKMGITASKISLKDGGVEMPGAIISGTGLGLVEDTEKFLMRVIEDKEEFLTPTAFIQSTHNTLSGQIAIALKCNNYNNTYAHRGFSFESALLDGMLLLNDNDADSVLVGGFDEITKQHNDIIRKTPFVKKEKINHLELIESNTPGTIAGEGVGYYTLTKDKNKETYCKLENLSMIYKPESVKEIESHLLYFLEANDTKMEDIDIFVAGFNGNINFDNPYHYLSEKYFSESTAYFKHLCGEYHTSSTFGLYVGSKILKHQRVPKIIKLNKDNFKTNSLKKILVYNHYRNINHSFFLLSAD